MTRSRGAVARSAWILAWLVVTAATQGAAVAQSPAAAAGLDAAFVTQTVPPSFELGAEAPVSITMRNSGTATWQAGDVFLATQEPQDNYYWCIQENRYGSRAGNRAQLPGDVAPGATVQFAFTVKPGSCVFAPAAPLRFRMLSQRFGTFGEETPDPGSATTTAAEYVAQQMPSTVPAGAAVSASVTFRNTTGATWTAAGGYALVPVTNGDSFGVTAVPIPGSVAPGATVRVPVRLTVPATTGSYSLQWRVSLQGGAFGQTSPVTTITVVPTAAVNYQGLWWAAPAGSESGWGINFAHQDTVIFATWFTYDANGAPWWLSMTAQQGIDGSYAGTLVASSGPPFSATPWNPGLVRNVAVGTGALTFTDANSGMFAYTVNGVTQTKRITRQVFGDLPTCTFALVNDVSQAFNYQDLWWAASGQEPGWGINLAHEGDTIFATWFTYDSAGAPMWLSGTGQRQDDGSFAGPLLRTTGPPFGADAFDAAKVQVTAVGSFSLAFADGLQGTFAYTVGDVSQTKAITRQVFRSPGTVCQ
jgi:hypothetical protein